MGQINLTVLDQENKIIEIRECQLISPEAQEKIHLFTEGIINEQIEKITEICPDIVIINQ